ncbi:MAG: relaxase/mobilization nuclease domain-containing protein [Clostridia bacterium]|nr:relaxase/mobilization nuclease domain-containing protein [Clostridia bacterium]
MATTNLIPLHIGRDGSIIKALRRTIGYVENPEKTENKQFISCYQCDPRTAAEEFALDRRKYSVHSGRGLHRNDVIAYHMRQSFKPGEITSEEANRLGYELAMRFTKGKHAFIVTTHTDKRHIHNHVIFSAVNVTGDHKFRDFHGSKKALARLSDLICLENGYSVIDHPMERRNGRKYNIWLGESKKRTHRDELREAIDIALMEKPRDMAAFLQLLSENGWEIKRGAHLAFRKPGQQRFMRMDSLGEEYSIEALNALFKGSRRHKPKRNYHSLPRQNERLALLIHIQEKMQSGKGPGYERWAKTYYLKQMAKTVLYMSEHDLDYATLKKKATEATEKNNELLNQINAIDKRLKEISALKIHIINYVKTKDVYQEYHRHGNSRKFAEAHEQELAMHQEAKKAFDALGLNKLPTIKSLSAEYEQQLAEKRKLYAEYQKVHAEMQEMLTVRANMEQILQQDEAAKDQERSRINAR